MSVALPFNFADLGIWPSNCADQRDWLNRLQSELNTLTTYINTHTQDIVILEQINEPTQTEWEIAWMAQTGKPLPIGVNATLWWWDTGIDDLGGIYGVTKGDNVVRPQQAAYPRNATVLIEQSTGSNLTTGAFYIDSGQEIVPDIGFTTKQTLTLEMQFGAMISYNSGSGFIGLDFMLDGTKLGTSQYGLAADVGIVHVDADGFLIGTILVPNVPPGTHTARVMVGNAQSPITPANITITQDGGIRQFTVRGFGL